LNCNQTSWIGFLITIAALNAPSVEAITTQPSPTNSANSNALESRLARLAATLKDKENQVSSANQLPSPPEVALGWANGSGGRGFANAGRVGWGDGYRGGFANVHPWRNGWADGGGFYNYGRY
jgi:rSAM-associated Gly-rich repeat protein